MQEAEEILRELKARRLEEEAELCRRHLKRNTDLTRLLELDPRSAVGTTGFRLVNHLSRPQTIPRHPITPPRPLTPPPPITPPQLTATEERSRARRELAVKNLAKFGFICRPGAAAPKLSSTSQFNPFKFP